MPKGPAWTEYEDEVLHAAREAGVRYKELVIVMPNRSADACMIRKNILKREAGLPMITKHRERDDWGGKDGSDRLRDAMMGFYQKRATA